MKDTKKITSPLLLLIAAMVWGFAFSAQKEASSTPPFILGTIRSLLAAIFLTVTIIILDAIKKNGRSLFKKEKGAAFTKEELIGGAICGVILALTNLFQQLGLMGGTSASKASFIIALYIVLVPIYAFFIGNRPEISALISLAVAVPGFYFLCMTEGFSLAASDIFIVLSTVIFPVYILTIDKYTSGVDPFRMSLVQFIVATVVSLIPALIFELDTSPGVIASDLPYIVILGIGSSGIAYTLQILGQRGISPTVSALILSLESVFGAVGAAIFLKESMNKSEILGAALIFLAVIVSQIDFKLFKRKAKNEKQ